ncbi:MAG: ATP synthase F1 subunit gamma [Candidatus Cloacimonetes bacterium]|nr:ATP synthase F1 subunit gamma [Candidatus Cloacimonadota bacterium]
MANIRDIKNRIESIKSTRQITNAMKMVAAANLRKAQNRIIKARPYADYINQMIQTVKIKHSDTLHPLLENNEQEQKAFVIVTSDRGLCGSFNYNILKLAGKYLNENPELDIICIGKKGYDYLKKRDIQIIDKHINLFNEMDFSSSRDIANKLISMYLDNNYGQISIIYNEFKSAIQQNVVIKQLFPITPPEDLEINLLDFIYEPDPYTIIDELTHKYIDVEIWRILLESSAAEQGARMTAMDSATENAHELIDNLTLYYNRARQAKITKEIIEIASGAEAINK